LAVEHFAKDYFRFNLAGNSVDVWTDPIDDFVFQRARFLFSDGPFELPFDLDLGVSIQLEPRLSGLGKLKNAIDPFRDNLGISFETNTNVKLNNEDGFFDEIYNRFIWLNQPLKVFSWSPELDNVQEAKKIFDGLITNPDFNERVVGFNATNFAFKLRDFINLPKFNETDGNLRDSSVNKPKRLLYGRTNGVRCTTLDALGEGFTFSGTITGVEGEEFVNISAGALTELDEGGEFNFEIAGVPIELKIDRILSDTSVQLSEFLDVSFTNITPIIVPERPNNFTNRNWHVSIGKLFEVNTTITTIVNARIFDIPDATDFNPGDVLIWKFGTVDETHRTIRRISGNQIFLTQSLFEVPKTGDPIRKIPLIKVFSEEKNFLFQRVGTDRDFTFTNNDNDFIINFEDDAELKATIPRFLKGTIVTAIGRVLTVTGGNFTDELRSRDHIRLKNNNVDLGFYEVLSIIDDDNLEVRRPFSAAWVNGLPLERKVVDYLQDNSPVGVDCYGVQDLLGKWIKYPAQVINNILSRVGVTNIDQSSFDGLNDQVYFITSLKLPLKFQGKEPDARTAIGYLNKSFLMSLFEKDGLVTIDALNAQRPAATSVPISDLDTFGEISIKTDTDIYKNIQLNYNHFDISPTTNNSGFKNEKSDVTSFQDVIGIDTSKEIDSYMFGDEFALLLANRFNWFHSRSQQVFTVRGKLNLIDFTIHDRVLVNFARNPDKIGQQNSKFKVAMIIETIRDGKDVTLVLNDLSDWFSVVGAVTENTANDYDNSPNQERAINGYITSNDLFLSDGSNIDDDTVDINKIM